MTSITPFLWFDNNVPEAVAFYKSVFPNARVETVNDFMATFELEGQRFNALNGGQHRFNEAISFFISVESQQEVDYFWSKLIADGGEESRCGWLKDKFGLSWQVVPTALSRYLSDPDRTKADRVMQAMLKMVKLDIADVDQGVCGLMPAGECLGQRLVIRTQPDAAVDGVADRLRPQGAVDEEVGDPALGDAEAEAAAIFEPALVSDRRHHEAVAGDGGDNAGMVRERLHEAAIDVAFDAARRTDGSIVRRP